MPAPSLTEIGKLTNLGLLRHYQQHQSWYIQQGKSIVGVARAAVRYTKIATGAAQVFSRDEVAEMLRIWLMNDSQWQALLKSKPHLPNSQYDIITDAMARHVVYDAYVQITS